MKKGFTLVELSIVIVIIGILMGMTVKGKSLIDSARIKADMATINKLRTAVAAYAADHNAKFPTESATAPVVAKFSATNLTDGNYITANDLRTKLGANPLTVQQVTIPPAANAAEAKQFTDRATGNDIAVIIGIETGGSNRDWKLGCMLDTSVDDGVTATGDIRYYASATDTTNRDAQACKNENDLTTRYGVLVF